MPFKQVSGEDGNDTYVEMTEEEIAELVKTSKPFQKVKRESVRNYRRLKELETPVTDETEVKPEPTPAPTLDIDGLFLTFKERLEKEASEKATVAAQKDKSVKDLMEKYKLSGQEFYDEIAGSNNPDRTATLLSRGRFTYEETPANPSDTRVKEGDELLDKILKKMHNR